jgi:hypothetical protein
MVDQKPVNSGGLGPLALRRQQQHEWQVSGGYLGDTPAAGTAQTAACRVQG